MQMREWKRGQLQMIRAIAGLLQGGGGAVFVYILMFAQGELISSQVAALLGAIASFLAGYGLFRWLGRTERATGLSSHPFDRTLPK
jgi:hypothetical protein